MATKNVNLENEAAVEMTEDEKKATVRKYVSFLASLKYLNHTIFRSTAQLSKSLKNNS